MISSVACIACQVGLPVTHSLACAQVLQGSVMDLLTAQCDRHSENIFIDRDGQLQYIDNDKSLGEVRTALLEPSSFDNSATRICSTMGQLQHLLVLGREMNTKRDASI